VFPRSVLRKVEERRVFDVTYDRDIKVLKALLKLVTQDGYYSYGNIKDKIQEMYGEEEDLTKWLTTKWLGGSLDRLKFRVKMRKGGRTYVRLDRKTLEDLAKRYDIPPEDREEEEYTWLSS